MNDSSVPSARTASQLAAGDRLPMIELFDASDGAATPLLRGRGPHLFLLTRAAGCPECGRFLDQLDESGGTLREWGAHVIVIASGAEVETRSLRSSIPSAFALLADPGESFAARTGLRPPALVITDEWGEVYSVQQVEEDHAFLSAAELEEWLRFIAVQCPECEAPEGLWREI